MPSADDTKLRGAIAAVQALIDHLGGRGVIIGGVAMGLLGSGRTTEGVDAVVLWSDQEPVRLIAAAAACGLEPRVDSAAEFAATSRVLLLRHSGSGIGVDISLGSLPFEEAMVAAATRVQAGTLTLSIPRAEDLVVMKAIANREKDLLDIAAVLKANPNLDREAILAQVQALAELLEAPEIVRDLQAVFRRAGGRRR
ncbi:MAG: hypothetical protein FJX77_04185 [Armatimonadetes bacterium]|nr:hypothetical protein [Armatimonadota bacterium]